VNQRFVGVAPCDSSPPHSLFFSRSAGSAGAYCSFNLARQRRRAQQLQSRVATALGVSRRTVLYRLAEFSRRAMKMHAAAEAGLA